MFQNLVKSSLTPTDRDTIGISLLRGRHVQNPHTDDELHFSPPRHSVSLVFLDMQGVPRFASPEEEARLTKRAMRRTISLEQVRITTCSITHFFRPAHLLQEADLHMTTAFDICI